MFRSGMTHIKELSVIMHRLAMQKRDEQPQLAQQQPALIWHFQMIQTYVTSLWMHAKKPILSNGTVIIHKSDRCWARANNEYVFKYVLLLIWQILYVERMTLLLKNEVEDFFTHFSRVA